MFDEFDEYDRDLSGLNDNFFEKSFEDDSKEENLIRNVYGLYYLDEILYIHSCLTIHFYQKNKNHNFKEIPEFNIQLSHEMDSY